MLETLQSRVRSLDENLMIHRGPTVNAMSMHSWSREEGADTSVLKGNLLSSSFH